MKFTKKWGLTYNFYHILEYPVSITSYHNIYILTVAYARVILAHARIKVKNVRKFKCRNIKRRP